MRDGRPVQVVEPALDVPVTVVTVEGATVTDRESRARALVDEQVNTPFDLSRATAAGHAAAAGRGRPPVLPRPAPRRRGRVVAGADRRRGVARLRRPAGRGGRGPARAAGAVRGRGRLAAVPARRRRAGPAARPVAPARRRAAPGAADGPAAATGPHRCRLGRHAPPRSGALRGGGRAGQGRAGHRLHDPPGRVPGAAVAAQRAAHLPRRRADGRAGPARVPCPGRLLHRHGAAPRRPGRRPHLPPTAGTGPRRRAAGVRRPGRPPGATDHPRRRGPGHQPYPAVPGHVQPATGQDRSAGPARGDLDAVGADRPLRQGGRGTRRQPAPRRAGGAGRGQRGAVRRGYGPAAGRAPGDPAGRGRRRPRPADLPADAAGRGGAAPGAVRRSRHRRALPRPAAARAGRRAGGPDPGRGGAGRRWTATELPGAGPAGERAGVAAAGARGAAEDTGGGAAAPRRRARRGAAGRAQGRLPLRTAGARTPGPPAAGDRHRRGGHGRAHRRPGPVAGPADHRPRPRAARGGGRAAAGPRRTGRPGVPHLHLRIHRAAPRASASRTAGW